MKAKDVLSPEDYRNYRNVRAVSVFFVLIGSILALGGVIGAIAAALGESIDPDHQIPPVAMYVTGIVGLIGAIGGIAALRGNRRRAPLVYAIAAIYLFGFPLGTLLSYVMFKGLNRYLDSSEQLRSAAGTAY